MPPNNTRAFADDDALDVDDSDSDVSDRLVGDSSSEESSGNSDLLKKKKGEISDEKSTEDDSDGSETTAFGDNSFDGDASSKDSDGENNSNRNVLAATTVAAASWYAIEKRRQRKLTQVPLVMGQIPKASHIESISNKLTKNQGILSKPIVPTMIVGTHGQLASAVAYMSPGPSSKMNVLRFEETVTSSLDGAEIVIEWEVPAARNTNTKISHPTVLILHGINNSSKYGYIKSLQRTMTNRGWNTVAMNFRGVAGRPMTTPRSYTAAYTGDLRSLVNQLVKRLDPTAPLFLVGNSLGANLITKYLGEEGLAGTLPSNVLAGISLGNPFSFRSNFIGFPFGQVIGSARKLNYFAQRRAMSMNHNAKQFSNSHHLNPTKIHLASLDAELAPTMIRTEAHPPFSTKIGYGHAKSGGADTNVSPAEDYWADSSCFRQGLHVSVPLLHVVAQDDNLCHWSSQYFLNYTLQNPNVLMVYTRTGGHLGWWHQGESGMDSWADEATADFIQAVLDTRNQTCKNTTAAIDDARNIYSAHRTPDGRKKRNGGASTLSTRALPGDCDSDSTIATTSSDHSSCNINDSPTVPRKATTTPSETYTRFQQVLLLQQKQSVRKEERILEKNRHVEKHESIRLARLLRSRL